MAKIVMDTARRLNIPPYCVFVRAYEVYSLSKGVAQEHWREYKLRQALEDVPSVVKDFCIDILTNRTPIVHRR